MPAPIAEIDYSFQIVSRDAAPNATGWTNATTTLPVSGLANVDVDMSGNLGDDLLVRVPSMPADQFVRRRTDSIPGTSGSISNLTVTEGASGLIATASNFTGTNRRYSLSGAPDWMTIDAASGLITYTDADVFATASVTVTASNVTGSANAAAQSFDVTVAQAPAPGAGQTYNVVLMGQSELYRTFSTNYAGLGSADAVDRDGNLTIFYKQTFTDSAAEVRKEVITNANKHSQHMVTLANYLNAVRPNDDFNFIMLVKSGTSALDVISDAGGRSFLDDQQIYDAAKADIGFTQPDALGVYWANADSTQMAARYADIWWGALTGTLSFDGTAITRNDTHYGSATYNNFLTDLFDTDVMKIGFGMFRFDIQTSNSSGGEDLARFLDIRHCIDRMMTTPQNLARAIPFERLYDPMTVLNPLGDLAHPDNSVDGLGRMAMGYGRGILGLLGLVSPSAPKFDQVTWTTGQLTIGSSAGDITTLRRIRGTPALPSGLPKVSRFRFEPADGSGEIIVPDGAITFGTGQIRINATSLKGGPFVAGDRVTFRMIGNNSSDDNEEAWLDYPVIADANMEAVDLLPLTGDELENTLSYDATSQRFEYYYNVNDSDVLPGESAIGSLLPFDLSSSEWQAQLVGSTNNGKNFWTGVGGKELDTNQGVDGFNDPPNADFTVVWDVDKEEGRDNANDNSASVGTNVVGDGPNNITISDLWGDPNISTSGSGTDAVAQGFIKLPFGRLRIWQHITHVQDSRTQVRVNTINNGGRYGNVAVFDAHLTVAQVAALGNPT